MLHTLLYHYPDNVTHYHYYNNTLIHNNRLLHSTIYIYIYQTTYDDGQPSDIPQPNIAVYRCVWHLQSSDTQ